MDCSAPAKLCEGAEAAAEVMGIGLLSALPLFVFCNKCDRRGEAETFSRHEVEDLLRKEGKLGDSLIGVFDTSSFEAGGIAAALDSVLHKLVEDHKRRGGKIPQRPQMTEEDSGFQIEQQILQQEQEMQLG